LVRVLVTSRSRERLAGEDYDGAGDQEVALVEVDVGPAQAAQFAATGGAGLLALAAGERIPAGIDDHPPAVAALFDHQEAP
jgi:hypothetical protein